jgi:hypothetical protein
MGKYKISKVKKKIKLKSKNGRKSSLSKKIKLKSKNRRKSSVNKKKRKLRGGEGEIPELTPADIKALKSLNITRKQFFDLLEDTGAVIKKLNEDEDQLEKIGISLKQLKAFLKMYYFNREHNTLETLKENLQMYQNHIIIEEVEEEEALKIRMLNTTKCNILVNDGKVQSAGPGSESVKPDGTGTGVESAIKSLNIKDDCDSRALCKWDGSKCTKKQSVKGVTEIPPNGLEIVIPTDIKKMKKEKKDGLEKLTLKEREELETIIKDGKLTLTEKDFETETINNWEQLSKEDKLKKLYLLDIKIKQLFKSYILELITAFNYIILEKFGNNIDNVKVLDVSYIFYNSIELRVESPELKIPRLDLEFKLYKEIAKSSKNADKTTNGGGFQRYETKYDEGRGDLGFKWGRCLNWIQKLTVGLPVMLLGISCASVAALPVLGVNFAVAALGTTLSPVMVVLAGITTGIDLFRRLDLLPAQFDHDAYRLPRDFMGLAETFFLYGLSPQDLSDNYKNWFYKFALPVENFTNNLIHTISIVDEYNTTDEKFSVGVWRDKTNQKDKQEEYRIDGRKTFFEMISGKAVPADNRDTTYS